MKMKKKKYQFKTVKEIADVANEDNLDNLTKCFVKWLKVMVAYKTEPKPLKKLIKLDDTSFGWIDDGKMDMHVTVKTKKK